MPERRPGPLGAPDRGGTAVDSSVLVAALVSWHEAHDAAFGALEAALAEEAGVVLPVDALIETYSVLTRLPAPHRLSPRDALDVMRGSLADAGVVGQSATSTWSLLAELARRDVAGGAVYDARILAAAARGGARRILTLNARDFERLADDRLTVVDPSRG